MKHFLKYSSISHNEQNTYHYPTPCRLPNPESRHSKTIDPQSLSHFSIKLNKTQIFLLFFNKTQQKENLFGFFNMTQRNRKSFWIFQYDSKKYKIFLDFSIRLKKNVKSFWIFQYDKKNTKNNYQGPIRIRMNNEGPGQT